MFEWRAELETGMHLIDDQHRQFGRFVNGFLKAYTRNRLDQDKLRQAFTFLQAYAREHLATEAGLMEEYEYPDKARHLGRHQYLTDWIHATAGRLESGLKLDGLAMEANAVLVDWFQTHIETVDKRLAEYLVQIAQDRRDSKLMQLIKGVFKGPQS